MAVQIRNPAQVELLSADFQRRYEPQFAWANALSAFSMLPGLRGFWPMSSFDSAGGARDLSGNGLALALFGNQAANVSGLAPYMDYPLDGSTHFAVDAAGFDILGTEIFVAAALRGLTLGGWFWFDTVAPGASMGLIGKYNDATNNRSYLLFFADADNTIRMDISSDGTAGTLDTVTGSAVTTGAWYFCAGRFTPSTELAVFVNGAKSTNLAGIAASLFNSNANFHIATYQNGAAGAFDGRASLCFLCAAALPDAIINQLYEQTRALFGV